MTFPQTSSSTLCPAQSRHREQRVMRRYLIWLIAACALWTSRAQEAAVQNVPRGGVAVTAASAPVATRPAHGKGQASSATRPDIKLPLPEKSVRFAIIGDSGTGGREQYEVAQQMEAYRQATNFDFVIMLGDNIYGSHSASDFVKKFEQPYKALLDAGVKFYASLGNHDDPNDERLYKPFNM